MKFEESVRLCGAMAVLLLCALPALAEHAETQSEVENLKARIAALEEARGEANTLIALEYLRSTPEFAPNSDTITAQLALAF